MNDLDAAAVLLDSWRRRGLVHVTLEDARKVLAEQELATVKAQDAERKRDRAARLGVDWRYLPD